jgi:uncharacterized damage-inducible protein DinB
MLEIIKNYYAFNSWATDSLLAACEQLSLEEYNAPGCSGNGSAGETLSHLITVQQGWIAWFEQKIEILDAVRLIMNEKLSTLAEVRARWMLVKDETNGFVDALTDDSLKEIRHFTRSNGKQESHPLWKLMMHTANHGTHTRGQIAASIRRAGHEPGDLDLLDYVMNVENK